ncbi:hypothetical protein J22TS1_19620 [Siminovitchia terrae]|uniref:hypothetical protein n=1 Tax=Siminovitchia terrae TaxID=1914933 RepID=UPI001B27DD37|nr:hypothetical protein [Siminovitchia terrae]GIN90911.1 hypothetical protein J22TS1_19620 [Siminovitchia terrae]
MNNLQYIIAWNIDPNEKAVVSVTEFHGGTARNIIPDPVTLGSVVIATFLLKRCNIKRERKIFVILKGLPF